MTGTTDMQYDNKQRLNGALRDAIGEAFGRGCKGPWGVNIVTPEGNTLAGGSLLLDGREIKSHPFFDSEVIQWNGPMWLILRSEDNTDDPIRIGVTFETEKKTERHTAHV